MTLLLPTPKVPFPPINVQTIEAGTVLHRTHAQGFNAAQFNPCKGQPTRFAPFSDAHGNCIPTLYAATSREAAAFESIFHDIDPAATFKTVRLSDVESRNVSKVSPKRDLRVVGLFSPDLKAWGISRTDLIETPKSTYAQTVLWATAIHAADAKVDGLLWTSRQCDPELCVVLFGDRVSEADFDVQEQIHVKNDPALLLELRTFGRRAGVTLIS